MSISQEIAALAADLPQEQWDLLDKAVALLERHEPDAAADNLNNALLELTPGADLFDLVDVLERALARHHRPVLAQTRAFKKDMKRFFHFLRVFIQNNDLAAALVIMSQYYNVFNAAGKKRCGSPLLQCHNTVDGEICATPYGAPDIAYCPKCGTARRLCRMRPLSPGRCRIHGGSTLTGVFKDGAKPAGRLKVYGETLSGRLQEMYVESITDLDYLSVAPEIAALATRNGQLMSQMGDTDYMVVTTGLNQAVSEIESAIKKGNLDRVEDAALTIRTLLVSAVDDYRRWDEIGKISSRLGRLTEAERKRIVEAQQTISVPEMYMIQQEMLVGIRDAATAAANFVWGMALANKMGDITPVQIRNEFLRELQGQLGGKKSPQLVEGIIIDEEE